MRGLIPLLLGLALYGCAVGPDFKRPAPPSSAYAPPPAAVGEQHSDYGAEVAANWYSLFKSEALNRLVRQALAANPDLEAARHNLRAAQYELQAVAGTSLPQLALAGKAERTHVNGSLLYEPNEKLQVTANQFSLGPSLAYDLDVFGRLRRTIEAQAAQTSSVGQQALNVYVTLVDQVVVTAFSYAATVEQLDVTRKLVDELQKQYDLTHLLEESGKIVRSETLQAQTQLEHAGRFARPGEAARCLSQRLVPADRPGAPGRHRSHAHLAGLHAPVAVARVVALEAGAAATGHPGS